MLAVVGALADGVLELDVDEDDALVVDVVELGAVVAGAVEAGAVEAAGDGGLRPPD